MSNMKVHLRILTLFVLSNLLLTTKALDYLCRPNGSFVINNPDSTKYRMVEVKDDLKKCSTTTFSDDFSTLQIDGCQMGHYVTLVFIKGSKQPLILTKNNFVAFRILCRGLPPGGIEILVSTSLGVRNHVEEIGHTNGTEITRVFSFVEDSDPIPLVTVSMKDKFEWIMETKDNHFVLPITCTAYPGENVTDGAGSLVLVENGCSKHGEVMPTFERVGDVDGTNGNSFSLEFNAFRINTHPILTVVCDMRICSGPTNTGCQSNCDSRRRRRALGRRKRDSGRITRTLVLEVPYVKTVTESDVPDSSQGDGHAAGDSQGPSA